jgi:hypothetical protein
MMPATRFGSPSRLVVCARIPVDVIDMAPDPIMALKELVDDTHVLHHLRVHRYPTAHHPIGIRRAIIPSPSP